MKLFTTNLGIAREAADGTLEVLDLAEPDLGALLSVDPELKQAKSADVLKRVALEDVALLAPVLSRISSSSPGTWSSSRQTRSGRCEIQ